MRFSGSKKENGMCRRLLEGLKEGVKCLRGDHMNLVYDIYLMSGSGRSVANLLTDTSYIIYTSVGSGIDLYDVHEGTVHYSLTDSALITGIAVYGILTVDSSGEYTGD